MIKSFLWTPTLVAVFLAIGTVTFFYFSFKLRDYTGEVFLGMILAAFRFLVSLKLYLTGAALIELAFLTALSFCEMPWAFLAGLILVDLFEGALLVFEIFWIVFRIFEIV